MQLLLSLKVILSGPLLNDLRAGKSVQQHARHATRRVSKTAAHCQDSVTCQAVYCQKLDKEAVMSSHLIGCERVQARGGLVHEEDLGVRHQSNPNVGTLALAACVGHYKHSAAECEDCQVLKVCQ